MSYRNVATIALAAALAGCGGRSMLPGGPAAAAPTNRAAVPDGAGRTTAYAFVYADPSGQPLAGEPVKLYPWTPCTKTSATTRSCPDALYGTTTNTNGEFVLANVPNGHYLLAIGDDDPTDLTHPTIHDQIWLKGGHQHLIAPTLPAEPTDAPFTIRVPAIEKSGDYRIATLNKWEVLCANAFDAQRAQRKLPAFVEDEWFVENTRAVVGYEVTKFYKPSSYAATLFTSDGTVVIGGTSCTSMATGTYSLPGPPRSVALDPRSLWFAATWYLADPKKIYSGDGLAQYPIDPRIYPNGAFPGFPQYP